jgi:hypothetical protein
MLKFTGCSRPIRGRKGRTRSLSVDARSFRKARSGASTKRGGGGGGRVSRLPPGESTKSDGRRPTYGGEPPSRRSNRPPRRPPTRGKAWRDLTREASEDYRRGRDGSSRSEVSREAKGRPVVRRRREGKGKTSAVRPRRAFRRGVRRPKTPGGGRDGVSR